MRNEEMASQRMSSKDDEANGREDEEEDDDEEPEEETDDELPKSDSRKLSSMVGRTGKATAEHQAG